jgi:hypothetical protein
VTENASTDTNTCFKNRKTFTKIATKEQEETAKSDPCVDRKNTNKFNDSKTDHWVAPSGQDGSGFTRLNEKFRGRY